MVLTDPQQSATDGSQLSIGWNEVQDSESGIVSADYGIAIAPGGATVRIWPSPAERAVKYDQPQSPIGTPLPLSSPARPAWPKSSHRAEPKPLPIPSRHPASEATPP